MGNTDIFYMFQRLCRGVRGAVRLQPFAGSTLLVAEPVIGCANPHVE